MDCPICRTSPVQVFPIAERDAESYICLRCGRYRLPGMLLDRLKFYTEEEKRALSRFLRNHQDKNDKGFTEVLIPGKFASYIANGIPQGPIAQLNELLRLVSQRTGNLGDFTSPEPLIVWAGRLGLPTVEHVDALAKAGQNEGKLAYIMRSQGSGKEPLPIFSLTMDGWKEVEKLKVAGHLSEPKAASWEPEEAKEYIQQLTLTDFRCFEKATIELQLPGTEKPQANITVLLGINGAGKTSLLKALVLGLMSESLRDSTLLFQNLVRTGSRVAKLSADCLSSSNQHIVATQLQKGDQVNIPLFDRSLSNTATVPAFLAAYGIRRIAARGAQYDLDRQDGRYPMRARRVASLFTEDAQLIPLAAWWPRAVAKQEVQALLEQVVPDELKLSPKLDASGELLVSFRGVELPETALSDGYRAFLAWFGDLLYRLTQAAEGQKLVDIKGIVLVDEIDLHLHPSWQQSIVDRISKALPKIQFVFTTHSPLIVGGVRKASLRVLRSDPQGISTIELPSEESYGRTPDYILLSDAFGLKQLRPDDFVKELEDVYRRIQAGDIEAAVTYTRMLALGEGGKT